MYLLNWDWENSRITANMGGVITNAEAEVLVDEIIENIICADVAGFEFELDYSLVRRLEAGVSDQFDRARKYLALSGAQKFVIVAPTQNEAELLIAQNIQAVLEGREEYRFAA